MCSALLLAWSYLSLGGGSVSATNGPSVAVGLKMGSEWSGASLVLTNSAAQQRLIAFSLVNTATNALTLTVKSKTSQGVSERQECRLTAGGSTRLVFNLRPKTLTLPFALEGLCGYGGNAASECRMPGSPSAHVDIFGRSKVGGSFLVTNVVMLSGAACILPTYEEEAFFPFCDKYGQFLHKDWPGKVHSDEELGSAGRVESAWLRNHAKSPIASGDQFGGWAAGPQLAATGRFRVDNYRGSWHLVDPEGRLFFSFGLAGVRKPPATAIRNRERYFAKDTDLADGRANFGAKNLVRKYGPDEDGSRFVERCRARVRAWGFNTIANWSDGTVFKDSHIPYVDTFSISGRKLRTGHGAIVDVFDPRFAAEVRAAAEKTAARSAADPWCVGWFVDNELNWGGSDIRTIARAAQVAEEGQPAKIALKRFLTARHSGVPDVRSVADSDLRAFSRHFAETYFQTVRTILREVAPETLYLGCRFALSRTPAEIWSIAEKYVDALSVNVYRLTPEGAWPEGLSRPVIIGEFHFGALDRGLLHAGCVAAGTQEERAGLFSHYVRKALSLPNLVGVHWFLYQDQPLTGRERDGECFQCGFVDVCDAPYAEMVEASRNLAQSLYDTYKMKLK